MVVAKTLHKDELQGSSEPVPPSKPSWCGSWLVVEPYPSERDKSQLGLLFPIYGK
jgi:hypothetical protein